MNHLSEQQQQQKQETAASAEAAMRANAEMEESMHLAAEVSSVLRRTSSRDRSKHKHGRRRSKSRSRGPDSNIIRGAHLLQQRILDGSAPELDGFGSMDFQSIGVQPRRLQATKVATKQKDANQVRDDQFRRRQPSTNRSAHNSSTTNVYKRTSLTSSSDSGTDHHRDTVCHDSNASPSGQLREYKDRLARLKQNRARRTDNVDPCFQREWFELDNLALTEGVNAGRSSHKRPSKLVISVLSSQQRTEDDAKTCPSLCSSSSSSVPAGESSRISFHQSRIYDDCVPYMNEADPVRTFEKMSQLDTSSPTQNNVHSNNLPFLDPCHAMQEQVSDILRDSHSSQQTKSYHSQQQEQTQKQATDAADQAQSTHTQRDFTSIDSIGATERHHIDRRKSRKSRFGFNRLLCTSQKNRNHLHQFNDNSHDHQKSDIKGQDRRRNCLRFDQKRDDNITLGTNESSYVSYQQGPQYHDPFHEAEALHQGMGAALISANHADATNSTNKF